MTNAELKELIHLLMMCGIMDKSALESGNITDEDWLRMESLIDKYQADKTEPEVHGDLISREALLKAMEEERQYLLARGLTGAEHILVHHCLPLIDNAPTIEYPFYQAAYQKIDEARKVIWDTSLPDACKVMKLRKLIDYECGSDMKGGAK